LNFETFDPPCRPRGRLLRTINAGLLARAREREALGFLQITLGAAEKRAWTGRFAVAYGMPGWRRAPDEGPSPWWYLGMFVLVLTLFALLTVLRQA
jgi:hypothetical protein